MREITIAGGGLAGLSLATALRLHGVPVTMCEAGDYPRHRVCGEFISGVSQGTLEALGIAECFADVRRQSTIAWFDGGREIHRDKLPEPALGISRYQLDARLRDRLASLGGEIHTHTRVRPEPQPGFVWTAGRRPCAGPWIGLKAHIRGIPMAADLEMRAGANGYAGLAGVEDGWTNVCGLFRLDRSIAATGSALLPAYLAAGGNGGLAEILRGAEWREKSFTAVAGFRLGRQPPLPGLLCLGDSESIIPPFTGNGMSMAFQAAECATRPLADWSAGAISWESAANAVRHALRRRFSRRLSVAAAIHPVLLATRGRALVRNLAAARLLPFRPMLALVR